MYKNLIIFTALFISFAQAQTLTIYTDADAGNSNDPCYVNTTYGNTDTVNLNASSSQRGFFHFDLSTIPAGSVIDSVKLQTYVTHKESDDTAGYLVSVNRVTNEWNEAYLTWNQRVSGVNWSTAGGDYESTAVCSTLGLGNSTGLKTIAEGVKFAQLVQRWLDGTTPNYGVIVMHSGTSGGQRSLANRESYADSYKTRLVVTYTPPTVYTVTLYPVADAANYYWTGYQDMTFGNTNSVNLNTSGTRRGFWLFDINSIPAGSTITEAEMKVYVSWVQTTATYNVSAYRVTNQWDESNLTWNSRKSGVSWVSAGGDYAGTAVSSNCDLGSTTGLKTAATGSGLAALVQDWLDGTYPNYGIMIMKPSAGGDQRAIKNRELATSEQRTYLTVKYTLPKRVFSAAADASTYSYAPDVTYGNTNDSSLCWSGVRRTFVKFDVNEIPSSDLIESAALYGYVTWSDVAESNAFTVGVYRITSDWDEPSVTWNRRKIGVNWTTAGGDFDSTPICYQYGLGHTTGMKLIADGNNLVNLVKGWVNGTIPNYGLMLRKPTSYDGTRNIACREINPVSQHLRLVIGYKNDDNTKPEIPIEIYTGTNTRTPNTSATLEEGLIVSLDSYDLNSKIFSERGLTADANDIQVYYAPAKAPIQTKVLSFNSSPNRNRILFKLQAPIPALNSCFDYYLRLGDSDIQRPTPKFEPALVWLDFENSLSTYSQYLVGTQTNFSIVQAGLPRTGVLQINKTSTTSDQCVRVSDVNVSGCTDVMVQFFFRFTNLNLGSTTATTTVCRGEWFDSSNTSLGTFSTTHTVGHSRGWIDTLMAGVTPRLTVPSNAAKLTLDFGLPSDVNGIMQIDEILVVPGKNTWQPEVKLQTDKYYPQVEIEQTGNSLITDAVASIHFVDSWSDIPSDSNKEWLWENVTEWNPDIDIYDEMPTSQTPAIVVTDDIGRLDINNVINTYGSVIAIREEGFIIKVEENRVYIAAEDLSGVLYALNYVADLLSTSVSISPSVMVDWPDNKIRTLHRLLWKSEVNGLSSDIDRLLEECHENRLNGIVFDSDAFWLAGDFNTTIYTTADAANYGDPSFQNINFGTTCSINLTTGNYRHAFFYFDVNSIPAGSRINSATMKAYVIWTQENDPTGYSVSVYPVTSSWNETTLTWIQRESGVNWSTAGGDYGSTPVSTSCQLGNTTGLKTVAEGNDFRDLVQSWIDGTTNNYGVMLTHPGQYGGQRAFAYRENYPSQKAQIIIDYTPEPNIVNVFKNAFERLRAEDVEPMISSWNFRNSAYTVNPDDAYNLNTGKWVEDEAYTFSNTLVYLSTKSNAFNIDTNGGDRPLVQRTPSSVFELRDASNNLLVEGTDYELVGGVTNSVLSPFGFRRLTTSSLTEGSTVYASYNYLAEIHGSTTWRTVCMSEPLAYDLAKSGIEAAINQLGVRWFCIGADEICNENIDGRDLARDMNNPELYADYMTKMYEMITDVNSSAHVITHADAMDKYHARGWVNIYTPEVPAGLITRAPADLITNPWNADVMNNHETIDWFGSNNKHMWGACGYGNVNFGVNWCREMAVARKKGYVADGVYFYDWHSRDYRELDETARYMWSSPPYVRFIDSDTVCIVDPLTEVNDVKLVTTGGTSTLTASDVNLPADDLFTASIDEKYYELTLPASPNWWYLDISDKYGFRHFVRDPNDD
jgi:hypothetical protein